MITSLALFLALNACRKPVDNTVVSTPKSQKKTTAPTTKKPTKVTPKIESKDELQKKVVIKKPVVKNPGKIICPKPIKDPNNPGQIICPISPAPIFNAEEANDFVCSELELELMSLSDSYTIKSFDKDSNGIFSDVEVNYMLSAITSGMSYDQHNEVLGQSGAFKYAAEFKNLNNEDFKSFTSDFSKRLNEQHGLDNDCQNTQKPTAPKTTQEIEENTTYSK